MSALKPELIVIFSILAVSVFLWRFSRDKVKLTFDQFVPALKVMLAIIVPISGLMLISQSFGLAIADAAPYFAGAVALPFLISASGMPPFLRALLLLGASVAFTCMVPADNYQHPLAAVVAGLVCWKSAQNLLKQETSTLEDFLPAYLWLVSIYWTKTVDSGAWVGHHQNLILASFVVAIFMRWIQDPFLKVDKLYVKRVCLAITGGLVLLILVTKVVVVMDLAKICAIGGAGYLLTYVLQAMDKVGPNESVSAKSFKQLLFIGIFTLLATRLFFTPGLIVLAIATAIATTSGAAMIAGLYWGSYIFLHTFIYKFNSNMTGINVMHPYTSAALYAGLLIAITAALLIRERIDNRAKALLLLAATILAPAATAFFLHAEPTSAMLLAVMIGCVLITIFSKALAGVEWRASIATPHSQDVVANVHTKDVVTVESKQILPVFGLFGYESAMLVPAQMIAFGFLTAELLDKGNNVDSSVRMTVLIALAVLSSVVLGIASFMSRQTATVVVDPAEVEAAIRAEEAKKVDILPHQASAEAAEEAAKESEKAKASE
ncbi:MAG: hypothetical protein SGJ27_10175 [Candidatus Melainabacteria bacterium]|nr:hypothetical protein [Candidatus Melainabacteria bacterium]